MGLLPVGATATTRTPATTANLGPGFDSLGMALDWADQATATVIDAGLDIQVEGVGEKILPRSKSHLVVRTLKDALNDLQFEVPGLAFKATNTIPLASGLGSSSAAIVSGLALAWGLAHPGTPLDRRWVLERAVRIEGHPDNVAPAVLGGFTISWQEGPGSASQTATAAVHEDLVVSVVVPELKLTTESSRKVLPTEIPFARAVNNTSRAALLVHALREDLGLLPAATRDYLHQDYRRGLYPWSMKLVDHLRGRGLAATISGAGPTVAIFHSQEATVTVTESLSEAPLTAKSQVRHLAVGRGVELL